MKNKKYKLIGILAVVVILGILVSTNLNQGQKKVVISKSLTEKKVNKALQIIPVKSYEINRTNKIDYTSSIYKDINNENFKKAFFNFSDFLKFQKDENKTVNIMYKKEDFKDSLRLLKTFSLKDQEINEINIRVIYEKDSVNLYRILRKVDNVLKIEEGVVLK